MRCWTIFVLLMLCLHVYEAARAVTNEDIRDAILSVVNMIRSSEDKLERHEFREKTLGDQVKKLLWAIDKRQRLDPVKGTISRLDERLAAVETILLQKDERERIQMQKVFVMIEQMHNSLPQLFETLKNDVTSSLPKESEEPSPSKDDLAKLQKEIETRLDNASSNLKNLEGELTKIREDNKNNFSSNQKFLEKYETKLTESNKQIGVLPDKCKEANDLQTSVILKALETQSNNLKQEIIASNAFAKDFDLKLLRIEAGAKDNHRRLNESTSQHFENVKRHSQEALKKYEEKINEHNKKIDLLPSAYKNENELQTKSILKAFEKQQDDVQKAFLNQVLKNCEMVDKHLKEAFPQQKKALDNLGSNLDKRFNLLNTKLDDDRESVRNKIETSHIAVEKMQNESTQIILNSLNRSFETTNFIKEALGDQKTIILSKLESYFEKNSNISKEFKQKLINSFITQQVKFDEMLTEIQRLNASERNRSDEVMKALEAYTSKTDRSRQHLLNTIREEFVKATSKRIEKALDENNNTLEFLRNEFKGITGNVSDVYKAVVKQEDKMNALSRKHKEENDLKTRELLQAIESLNNQTITNINDHQSIETAEAVSKLRETEKMILNTIDNQSKNIQTNLQTFLQAFEKELVFVTNAATSDLKDHVDRTSTIELQEFNAKFDALSSSLSNENAIIQERKRDMNTILEQTKMIETVVENTRDVCKGFFKENAFNPMTDECIVGTGQNLDGAIRSIHDLREKADENYVTGKYFKLALSNVSQKIWR
ncbi:hypothetical protein FQR65_LT01720 [Abscondita terminalis]|nr:hypothetical protein FQR65_LT01720 [Abscondita terminalis]